MKRFASLTILSVLFFLSPLTAFAYTIQPTTDTNLVQGVGGGGQWDGGTLGDSVAQRFTTVGAGTAGQIVIDFTYRSSEGTPTNPITYKIYADNGSGTAPSGSALDTITSTVSPSDFADNSCATTATRTFSGVSLSASTYYWIIASKSNSDGKWYYDCGNNTATGPNYGYMRTGSYYAYTGTLNFILTVTPAAVLSPSNILGWFHWDW